MKTLIILAIILAIFSAYFIYNTEKSISVEGRGNAIPVGIDIIKPFLKGALNLSETAIKPKINDMLQSELTEEIKSKAVDIKDKILNEAISLIKTPIENKAQELICPSK